MDSAIKLLSATQTQDDDGIFQPTYTPRAVFCKVSSITRAEFFQAGRNGLNPAFVFTIFAGDYAGEEIVEYEGETYSIYRTYNKDADYMELYAEKKGGTYGKNTN